ncbi:hypothetical protein AAH050_10230, partial [Bacteroides thetaiotaomicron]
HRFTGAVDVKHQVADAVNDDQPIAFVLTLGADLYTVSKLLGHADVKMTQVYAKIINKKKDEAVNLVNGLFH